MSHDTPSITLPTKTTEGQSPLVTTGVASATQTPQTAIGALIQTTPPNVTYVQYSLAHEPQYLPQIRQLISKDLSEPYSIYVYRYFLYQWAELCFMAVDTTITTSTNNLVGVVICKLEHHRNGPLRGYIAMLATKDTYRGQGIAKTLVSLAIDLMISQDADEIALETEETNTAAMRLYESLGFLRSKKLHRYYLNGNSAYRLLLYLKPGVGEIPLDPMAGPGQYDEPGSGSGHGGGGDWDAYNNLPPSAQDDPNFGPGGQGGAVGIQGDYFGGGSHIV